MKRWKQEQGFTLLELMITIAILGILMIFVSQLLGFNVRLVKQEDAAIEKLENVRIAASRIMKTVRESDATGISYIVENGEKLVKSYQNTLLNLTPRTTKPVNTMLWYYYDNSGTHSGTGYGELRDGNGNVVASHIQVMELTHKGSYLQIKMGSDLGKSNTYLYVCIPLAQAQGGQQPPPISPDVIAYYRFEPGGERNDETSNENDGTFIGNVKWVDGISGKALWLDGNSYVLVEDSPSLDSIDRELTIDLWCHPLRLDNSKNILLTRTNGINGFELYVDQDGRVVFNVKHDSITSITRLPLNTWSHIRVTFRTDGTICIYINDMTRPDAQDTTWKFDVKDTSEMWIGAEKHGNRSKNEFVGYLDEIMIMKTVHE